MATDAAIVEPKRCAVLAGSRLPGKGLARSRFGDAEWWWRVRLSHSQRRELAGVSPGCPGPNPKQDRAASRAERWAGGIGSERTG